MKNKLLQQVIDYGLISILFIFPLSLNFAFISKSDPGHPLFSVNISLADILIGVILLLWVIKLFIEKEWKQINYPPYPVLFFIGVGILSFANASLKSDWLKDTVQLIEYLLLLFILLINNFKTINYQAIKHTLFFLTSIILLIAFIQHIFLNGDTYLIRGLFSNNNIMGVFLCITIPFIYFELLNCRKISKKSWMIILLLLSVIVITSASAVLSILVGLLVGSWIYSKKVFFRFLSIIFVIGILYPFLLPHKNAGQIKKLTSIYEQGSISENYYRRLTMLGHFGKNTLFFKNLGENFIQITTDDFFNVALPKPVKGKRYKELEGKKNIKNRYLEMQAALNLISENTLLGIGLGNYQNQIGTYFKELPKVNTAEPNQNNTYLIVASTTGILGLTFFIWIIFFLIRKQFTNIQEDKKDITSLSILGSVIAVSVEGLFSMLLNAGILVPLVFLFYLAFTQNVVINKQN